jgi:DNA repair protein RadA/Sms
MAKKDVFYFCSDCGSTHSKWSGKCDDCGAWNTITEDKFTQVPKSLSKKVIAANSSAVELHYLNEDIEEIARLSVGISEFDRVLGGGVVPGSAILIGGDPGIGKSTLLLQAVIALGEAQNKCIYISGEESVDQIKLRAKRLSLKSENVRIASITSLAEIVSLLNKEHDTGLVVIDSIQTMFAENIESAPGTVTQVRVCAFELIRLAKSRGFAVIFVGHVTKDGAIAGPKVLEHMVDTVLYFEGERGHQFRIIRAVKNRFGAANEIGVFEMQEGGLIEVTNPSAIFLPTSKEVVSGSCIFPGIEGSRPILLEIQALVVPSFLATPRRATVGWDQNRLAMMIAVLNSRYGVSVLDKEVYLNVTGGMKIAEPAGDLAVIAAIISAVFNNPIPKDYIFFGEVGLSGELRPVVNSELRLAEAEKLGFTVAVIPSATKIKMSNMKLVALSHIKELYKVFKP